MNRHYPPSIEEVWDSFERLMKAKLEEIDYMAREMYREMAMLRTTNDATIRAFMQESFAELWECVATQQEEKTKRRVRS